MTIPNPSAVAEMIEKLTDPEMDLFFAERDSIAATLKAMAQCLRDQDQIIDEMYVVAADYAFTLKRSVGNQFATIVPEWLADDLKDSDDDAIYDRPTLKVSYDVKGKNLRRADAAVFRAAKLSPAFGGVDVEVQRRYVGFEFDTESDARALKQRLEAKGYGVELVGVPG